MGAARFNLVRTDFTVKNHPEVDAESLSAIYNRPISLPLVDDLGYPCAVPISQQETDEDLTYRFGSGNRSKASVLHRHDIGLSCDYITSETRSLLRAWKKARVLVRLAPGYGRHTMLAWRPRMTADTSYLDLTSITTLSKEYEATSINYWNDFHDGLEAMCKPSSGYQRIVATPSGTGAIFEKGLTNLADPAYPQSGNLGWTAFGTGVTLTWNQYGFGADDCPDSMHVAATHITGNRFIYFDLPSTLGGVSPGYDGTLNMAVWIKGRLTSEAEIAFYNNGSRDADSAVTLDGDYSDWTRIDVQSVCTLITGQTKTLNIRLLPSDSDQSCDFEVGAICCYFDYIGSQYSQIFPQWQPYNAAKDKEYMVTSNDFQLPPTGSMHVSGYLPAWYKDYDSCLMALAGPDDLADGGGAFYLLADNNAAMRLIFRLSDSRGIVGEVTLVPGAPNTFGVSWDHTGGDLYHNGVLVSSSHTSAYYEKSFPDEPLVIGGTGYHARGAWPLIINTFRLEREAWDAERMAQEHATLADDGSLGVIIPARGRLYEIAKVPSTPRIAEGGTHWIGNLILRQMEYEHVLADISGKEY